VQTQLVAAACRIHPLLVRPGGAPDTFGRELAERARARQGSLRAVSRVTDISVAEMSAIARGQVRPHLRVAIALEVAAAGGTVVPRSAASRPRAGRGRDSGLRKALRRAGRATAVVPSLRALATALGTTPAHLREVDPRGTALLLSHATAARRRDVAAGRFLVFEQIQRAVALASRSGPGFGRRRIERHLDKPGVLRAAWARAALSRARNSAARPRAERPRRAMSNP